MKFIGYTVLVLGAIIGLGLAFSSASSGNGGSRQLSSYEQCYVDSLRATAGRFENDTRTYYTVTEDEVVAMAKANARLECAGK